MEKHCDTCKDFRRPTGFCDYWNILIAKDPRRMGCDMHSRKKNKGLLKKERK